MPFHISIQQFVIKIDNVSSVAVFLTRLESFFFVCLIYFELGSGKVQSEITETSQKPMSGSLTLVQIENTQNDS